MNRRDRESEFYIGEWHQDGSVNGYRITGANLLAIAYEVENIRGSYPRRVRAGASLENVLLYWGRDLKRLTAERLIGSRKGQNDWYFADKAYTVESGVLK